MMHTHSSNPSKFNPINDSGSGELQDLSTSQRKTIVNLNLMTSERYSFKNKSMNSKEGLNSSQKLVQNALIIQENNSTPQSNSVLKQQMT